MKFLVDAQLPRRLADWLSQAGHDTCHTLDLPERNKTTDSAIMALADQEQRIVITKDDDFVQSFVLNGKPARLLLVATGNIGNAALEAIFRDHLHTIQAGFENHRFLELGQRNLIVHE